MRRIEMSPVKLLPCYSDSINLLRLRRRARIIAPGHVASSRRGRAIRRRNLSLMKSGRRILSKAR